ncbi:MAG: phage tail tape measure protein, partial [Bacteroides sp.]|nr:phage tail tape measure protein [Bacteroides sp.]
MANETKISELVDKKALDDLSLLNLRINTIAESYKKTVAEIGSGISIKVNGIQDYSEKFQKLTTAIEKGIVADKALKDAKKEQEALLQNISSAIKNNAEAIRAEAEANRLNKAAELDASKAKTEALKHEKLLNQAKKQTKVTIEEAIAIMKQEIKTERDAIEQSRLLRNAKKDVDHTTEEGRKLIMQMNAVIDRNTETCRRNADAMVKQKMTIGDYKEQVKAAIISIENGDRSMKNFGIVAKGFSGILRTQVSSSLHEVSIGIGSMIKGMIGAQAVIGGIQRFFAAIRTGIGSVINFEAANSNLAAILGTTSSNIKELIGDAQRLGMTTRYTASEVTYLQTELAKLGFSRQEILESTESILKFAQATGADLPDAAALAGASLRMFGADTKDTERYVSAMAVATAKSALSFSYLQTAMPIVGPVAKAFNFQIEDTLALLGKLSDAGFDASMAATATRNILLNLADGSGNLAKALGGPVRTLPELVDGLLKLKAQGVDLNSTLEMTDKRSVAAFNAFLTAADKIIPLREQITNVDGELTDMADTMVDNVQGAIANLSSAWESFVLSFSNSTGPAKEFLNWMADKIRGIASDLKSPEQKVLQIETNFRELAKNEANNRVLAAEKEFNLEYRRLLDSGITEEEARNTAIERLSKKRIEISSQEYAEVKRLKRTAEYATFEYQNMPGDKWIKNALARPFSIV